MRDQDERIQAELDHLVEAALQTYADPGAGFGIEDRVLAALTAEKIRSRARPVALPRPLRRPIWPIGLAVAAAILLAVALMHHYGTRPAVRATVQPARPQHSSDPRQFQVRVQDARPHPTAARALTASTHVTTRLSIPPKVITQPAALPKLDVFPTPQPLTAEEQALTVYVQRTPPSALAVLSQAQTQEEELIALAAAHVPPRNPPAEGPN